MEFFGRSDTMNAIMINKLNKSYGKARGIINLDLEVKKGEIFGFVGPNGAGKSTTIRTLLGLLRPDSGSASIFDLDIVSDKETILSRIGYMPGEMNFYEGMKVRDVIKLSADLFGKDCQTEAQRLCKLFDLDVERKVNQLSLGNKKKVGIVCAFQHFPELLILDEPTSGLDPLMQRKFFELVRERNAAGATIFISSHILSEIQKNCSRAAVIREGKIVACGSVSELTKFDTGDSSVHHAAKKIQIIGVDALPEVLTNNLHGIRNVVLDKDSVSFLYFGNVKKLIEKLEGVSFYDINITDPELEEIFIHFYEGV